MTALLTDNLPLLAGAPNGIKKLRELILELAVRGKLVEQDASDEPASELLKQIAAEKARLVAEGKVKKQKPLPEVPLDEASYGLPVSWEWTHLGEITNFGTTTKKDEIPDDAWVLDLEDIEKDTSRLLQKTRFFERNSLSDKNSFTKGDVLYGKLRPYLNKVLVAEEDGFCTTEILPFRCYGPFVARYFMIALKSPYFLNYVNARSYGMKMPRLGTEDGRQAFFPLAPLAEQHRIVAKVDELMTLCDRLEAQQADAASAHAQLVKALLESLTQASVLTAKDGGNAGNAGAIAGHEFATNWQRLAEHFHTLFSTEPSIDALKQTLLQLAVMGKLVPQDPADEPASELLKRIHAEKLHVVKEGKYKPVKESDGIRENEQQFQLPNSWVWVRLADIAFQVTDGAHHTPTYIETGVPFLSVKDMSAGYLDFSATRFISEEEHSQLAKRCCPQQGDLLLTKIGTTGVPVVIATNIAFSIFVSVALIKAPWALLDVKYLQMLIGSPFVKKQSEEGTEGVGNKNLVLRKISNFLLALPPLAEQHRIVAKVDQLMALCDQLKTQLSQARQLNQQLASTLVEQAVA